MGGGYDPDAHRERIQRIQTLRKKSLNSHGVDLDAALEYRKLSTPNNNSQPWGYCEFKREHFYDYGIGTYFYFELLVKLMYYFFFCTILAAPIMWMYYNAASGEVQVDYYFEGLSTGNMGLENLNFTMYGLNKQAIGEYAAYIDFGITLMTVVFIWLLDRSRKNHVLEYSKKVLSVSRYAIEVHGLPKDSDDRLDLAMHFQDMFGTVVDVVLAYNDAHLLDLFVERGNLKIKLQGQKLEKKEEETIQTTLDKIAKLDEQILIEEDKPRHCILGYVLFNHQSTAVKALAAYEKVSHLPQCCLNHRYKFHKKKITLARAPEPSNILYKNLRFTSSARRRRKIITFVATVILVAVSAGVAFSAQLYRKNLGSASDQCEYIPTYEEAVDGTEAYQECFCLSLGSSIFQYKTFCNMYYEDYIQATALNRASTFVITLLNIIIQVIVVRLARAERHGSKTREEASILEKLFIALFINTGLVLLFVNADLSGILPIGNVFGGTYDDLYPEWYNSVGYAITLTMILNMFTSLGQCAKTCCGKCRRSNMQKNWESKKSKFHSQNEVDAYFEGGEFALAVRYSSLLVLFFVTCIYSPALPILFPVAGCTVAITYVSTKYGFLNYYATPPHYDDTMEEEFIQLVPWAVWFHCCMAAWVYSGPVFVAADGYVDLDQYINVAEDSLSGYGFGSIAARLSNWSALPFWALSILFPLFQVLKVFLANCACKLCVDYVEGHQNAKMLKAYKGFPDYWEAVRLATMESYHIHKNKEYVHAFTRTTSGGQMFPEEVLTNDPYTGDDEMGSVRLGAADVLLQQLDAKTILPSRRGKGILSAFGKKKKKIVKKKIIKKRIVRKKKKVAPAPVEMDSMEDYDDEDDY